MARGTKKRIVSTDPAVIIHDANELRELVECFQAEGKTVVMANGAFDLLHVGHVRCLRDAKSRGDYLIVAVNSDASVKKYKNPKLPIQGIDDRMEILASLRWVDYIVSFDEVTCDAILETVKPDIVAKGTDYTEETVPERETIEGFGGKIVIVGDAKDHATSKLIQRIRRLKM
ncbi:MAG: adenylyltransferase/cytidyltransferase family protein [Planctomycetota bacterium]